MKEHLYINSEYLEFCIQGLEKLKKHYKKRVKGVVITEKDAEREESLEIIISAICHGQEIFKKLLATKGNNDTN